MSTNAPSYRGYRFPPEIISHVVWLYHRFCLSFRDVEDLLAQRGILVSYETIRQWCRKFGPEYARGLKRRQGRLGDTWHLDEFFVTIRSKRQYLWRRSANRHALCCPRYEPVRQQPSGGLPPANPDEGTANAPVQIASSGATLLVGPGSHPESLQGWTPPRQFRQPPYPASPIFPGLVRGDLRLKHSVLDRRFRPRPRSIDAK